MTIAILLFMTQKILQQNTSHLDTWLEGYRSSIHARQAYRSPTAREAEYFIEDFDRAMKGEVDFEHLGELGYSAKQGYDKASKKSYILLENEHDTKRSWGAYIIETSRSPKHVIAAPHPRADKSSESIALDLWRETPGAIYMVAGAHRLAADKEGDVTRHTDSLFHKMSAHLADKNLSHVQLHGFKDENSPDEDIIVSSASSPITDTHHAIVDEISDSTDARVGTNWNGRMKPLRGYVNRLGRAIDSSNPPFVHIEMSHSVRHSASSLKKILPAIAKGLHH